MGRLPRRNLGAGVYHIYNRCANNLWILDSPECKDKFLELLERLSGKYELNIYHYCVMSNHFHIAAEGNMKNISSFVSGLSCQYSKFYHKISQNGFGPVWQGRFKSVIVQKSVYLSRLGRYIELNPVRAGIVDPANIVDYLWSSARFYLTDEKSPVIAPEKHPLWQSPFDEKFRQNYAEYLSLPYDEDLKEFRSYASVLGDKAFLVRLSSQAGRLFLRPGRPAKENNLIANE